MNNQATIGRLIVIRSQGLRLKALVSRANPINDQLKYALIVQEIVERCRIISMLGQRIERAEIENV